MTELDDLVEQLGAVLSAPDVPLRKRTDWARDKKWQAGDIAKAIPASKFDDVVRRLEERGTDITAGLLRSYAEVAKAYPPADRTVKAAWTVYREARILPPDQRPTVLRDGQTLRGVRMELGKGPMDQRKFKRQPIERRAWNIVEELQDEQVRELVMREINSSSADRKARRAARSTLDELAAQKKLIDAELRKRAREPSAERQYWQASKELLEAARFVYSIARLHSLHPDALDESRWKDITETLRDLGDSSHDVADKIQGLGGDDVIEGEDLDDLLELAAGDDEIEDAEIIGDQ